MPTLLLNLRNVPEDEADEVRELLERNHIAFYETPPSRWGISMGGIWVGDTDQAAQARRLLDDYQLERARRARAEYERHKRAGTADTLLARLLRDPVRTVFFSAVAAALLYFLIRPFFLIGAD